MYKVHRANWFYNLHYNLTLENNTVLYSAQCHSCLHSNCLFDPDNSTILLIRPYLMQQSDRINEVSLIIESADKFFHMLW